MKPTLALGLLLALVGTTFADDLSNCLHNGENTDEAVQMCIDQQQERICNTALEALKDCAPETIKRLCLGMISHKLSPEQYGECIGASRSDCRTYKLLASTSCKEPRQ